MCEMMMPLIMVVSFPTSREPRQAVGRTWSMVVGTLLLVLLRKCYRLVDQGRDQLDGPRQRGAGSRPRHGEAGGGSYRWRLQSVRGWRDTDDLGERAAEGPEAVEADVEAHVGDRDG